MQGSIILRNPFLHWDQLLFTSSGSKRANRCQAVLPFVDVRFDLKDKLTVTLKWSELGKGDVEQQSIKCQFKMNRSNALVVPMW